MYLRIQITAKAGRTPIISRPRQPITSYRKPYARLENRNPSPHELCRMELIRPRERAGHDSIASEAPAGHSAPMPMPSMARKKNRNAKVGEKPAMKLQTEYQKIEIISGILRPTRSASQ